MPKRSLVFGNVPVSADAIDQLYRMAWHYAIHRWRLRALDEDVRDIVQEAVACATASMSRGEYDPRRGEWGKWAYYQVSGQSAYRYRMLARRRASQADYDVDWLSSRPDVDHTEPPTDEEYLLTLPKKYQDLAGRFLEGKRMVDIAREDGVSIQAVFARKERLARWLKVNKGGMRDGDDA